MPGSAVIADNIICVAGISTNAIIRTVVLLMCYSFNKEPSRRSY